MDDQKQHVIDTLKQANNVLVTVKSNPSIDQLAACIALTLILNELGKHGTAVFSGQVPSVLEFLEPEKTIEQNTDSLRDFIISLDKAKADKLRYKVEDEVVKIFITPYRTSLSDKDLEFGQGDFNVDAVVALGVHDQNDVDTAITAHGRILHDATVISLNTEGGASEMLGSINWTDTNVSSLSEMIATIADQLAEGSKKEKEREKEGVGIIDNQVATALLTGIVAETERFGNAKTRPETMEVAAKLLAAGANQELVATQLSAPEPVPSPRPAESGQAAFVSGSAPIPASEPAVVLQNAGRGTDATNSDTASNDDGQLSINHQDDDSGDDSVFTDRPSLPSSSASMAPIMPAPMVTKAMLQQDVDPVGIFSSLPPVVPTSGQIPPVYDPSQFMPSRPSGIQPAFPPFPQMSQAAYNSPNLPAPPVSLPVPAVSSAPAPASVPVPALTLAPTVDLAGQGGLGEEQAALEYLKEHKIEGGSRQRLEPLLDEQHSEELPKIGPAVAEPHEDAQPPILKNNKYALQPPTFNNQPLTANLPDGAGLQPPAGPVGGSASISTDAPILKHEKPEGSPVEPVSPISIPTPPTPSPVSPSQQDVKPEPSIELQDAVLHDSHRLNELADKLPKNEPSKDEQPPEPEIPQEPITQTAESEPVTTVTIPPAPDPVVAASPASLSVTEPSAPSASTTTEPADEADKHTQKAESQNVQDVQNAQNAEPPKLEAAKLDEQSTPVTTSSDAAQVGKKLSEPKPEASAPSLQPSPQESPVLQAAPLDPASYHISELENELEKETGNAQPKPGDPSSHPPEQVDQASQPKLEAALDQSSHTSPSDTSVTATSATNTSVPIAPTIKLPSPEITPPTGTPQMSPASPPPPVPPPIPGA